MIRRSLIPFICLMVATTSPLSAQGPKETYWQAGVAKLPITPSEPMWMSGYGGRNKPASGKLIELWAKALVLQDANGHRSILVTLDLVGIDRQFSDEVCADITKRFGIERDGIMLAVSHTHCGPVVGRNLLAMYQLDEENLRRVKAYTKELHGKILEVVGAAAGKMSAARVCWGNGYTTFAVNRRNNKEADVPKLRDLGLLKGPVDHEVPVLSLRDPDGKIRALVFGYACHATVMDFYQWFGDYPGLAQQALEKRHPDAIAMFFAGCGADQNPLPRRNVPLAERYGEQLADAVDMVLKAPMANLSPTLKTSYTRIDLPFAELPTKAKLELDTKDKSRYIATRAKELLKEFEKNGSLSPTYPYPIQAWRLGNELTWISLGGEVVVDYSLRLKKELGKVWVTGYANDVMAYIPSARVLKEGGYEGASAMIFYGLPSPWGPPVEELIIRGVHNQVGKVK